MRKSRQLLGQFALTLVLMLGSNMLVAQEVKLASGDVVRINVYGQEDLRTTARIDDKGAISFPLLGEVALGGLTTRQAELRIGDLLSRGNIVVNPQVNVFIEERQNTESESVTILGQVRLPGRFPVDPLAGESAQTVIGLLALAGGLVQDAADRLVLTRQTSDGTTQLEVDLIKLLRDGDLTQNHALLPGDVVFVPRMDVFYIYGEVRKPGRYRLEHDMTVMQAISVSGGLTPRANDKDVRVWRRLENGEFEDRKVDVPEMLRPQDVLFVREGLF